MALGRCILALAIVRRAGGVVSQAQDSLPEFPRETALPRETAFARETPNGEGPTRLEKL